MIGTDFNPSSWDHWFLDASFVVISAIGVGTFSLFAFFIRLLIKRELDRLNSTLSSIQDNFKEFTGLFQKKFEDHEHRLSMLEGAYFSPEGEYIGPERRKNKR
jgi:hypothetical protein